MTTGTSGHPSRQMRRRRAATITVAAVVVLAGIGVAIVAALSGAGGGAAGPTPPAPNTAAPTPEPTPEAPDPIHVIAMGDMLPHDTVHANALRADGTYDYSSFFAGISDQLAAADVTFCNQEVPSAGVEFGVSGYPTFNAPVEFAQDLRNVVGCDLVNLATNHNADEGTAGIAATRGVWDRLGPAIVDGANRNAEEQRTVPMYEVDGVKIALVSFADFSNAQIDNVSMNFIGDDALVTDLLTTAREQADVVIVSAHWGTEDSHEVNDAQRAFAQRVSDLGADVIIGTGPHVLQEVSWLDRSGGGRTLVWYSLGNMLSTQLGLDQLTGVIAGFDIVRDVDGNLSIADPTAILTYMHYDWTPEQEAVEDLLARTNLSITPLADADELLARTRFGVTAADQMQASTEILGADVQVLDR